MTEEEKEKELEEEEEKEIMTKWSYVVGITALFATLSIGFILESNHIYWLPEAGVGVLMGLFCALGAKLAGNEHMLSSERFDFEFFMTWLLPPIIFEAGFNMNVAAFFDNAGPTVFFAFVGTFASTFIVGGLVFYAGQLGLCYALDGLAALTFGSLISATDPVTVLAVFQALGVKIDLFSMVFGESVLNDAVAIVLSNTLVSFLYVPVSQEAIIGAVLSFLQIFIGSMVIGIVAGMLSALVFKHMGLKHHEEIVFLEAALSFPFPWAAYFIAEALKLSGIVTILFCGIVMATYTRNNFSTKSVTLTAGAYKCIALVAETYVFVYLGMAMVTFPIFESTVWLLMVYALLACFVGRLHIYIGSWIFNCFRSTESHPPAITPQYMFVMWFSGLRGGVAFALASVSYGRMDFARHCGGIETNDGVECTGELNDSLAIMQVTMLIAVFTIFIFGGSITRVCQICDVIDKTKKIRKNPNRRPVVENTHNYLLELLTYDKVYREEATQRFEGGLDGTAKQLVETPAEANWRELADVNHATYTFKSTADIKQSITPEGMQMVMQGNGTTVAEMSLHDKLDELRSVLPGASSSTLRKLLDEHGGDLSKAMAAARAANGSVKDML